MATPQIVPCYDPRPLPHDRVGRNILNAAVTSLCHKPCHVIFVIAVEERPKVTGSCGRWFATIGTSAPLPLAFAFALASLSPAGSAGLSPRLRSPAGVTFAPLGAPRTVGHHRTTKETGALAVPPERRVP